MANATDSKIRLRFHAQDGSPACYRVGLQCKLQELLKRFCKEKELEYKCVTFLNDGSRLHPSKTIAQLGLRDGDEIEAMLSQCGGGPSN